MRGRPTFLVFSRGVSAESARRRLLPGRLRHLEDAAHRELLDSAVAAGREAGCAIAIASPEPLADAPGVEVLPQRGERFGARLEHAVAGAFARGPEILVVAAADVPGLSASHVARAIELLRDDPDRVVLGPSPDGGLYLIAMARPIAGLADAARWCRHETLRDLERSLARAGRAVVRLAPLADLDRAVDLSGWLKRQKAGRGAGLARPLARLVKILRSALADLRPTVPFDLGRIAGGFAAPRVGRAPPAPSPLPF